MDLKGFRFRRSHALLLLILLLALANFFVIYPKMHDSPVPTEWSVGIDFGRYYIVNEGNIFRSRTDALTWQSGINNYGSVDVLPKIFFALENIITGTTHFPDDLQLHYVFPLVAIILLPLFISVFYFFCAKREDKIKFFDWLLVIGLSIFPLASALNPVTGNTNGTGITRALFILIIILLVMIVVTNDKKLKIFYIILVTPFFYFYHTWSYYLLIYIMIVSLYLFIRKRFSSISNLMLYTLLVFVVYAIYFNIQLMTEPSMIIENFNHISINLPAMSFTMKTSSNLINYQSVSVLYRFTQQLNSILFLIPGVVFGVQYLRSFRRNGLLEHVLFSLLLAQVFIGMALFVWDGALGAYSRIFESYIYIAMLLFVYFLVTTRGRYKILTQATVISIIFMCAFSYITYPPELRVSLAPVEFEGVTFAGTHISDTAYIFSDFRIGTPLLYFDQKGIQTIDSINQPEDVTGEILNRSYYSVNAPEKILDKTIGNKNYYVILSSFQSTMGLQDPSLFQYKPAGKNFMNAWKNQEKFNEIYSSRYFSVQSRNSRDEIFVPDNSISYGNPFSEYL